MFILFQNTLLIYLLSIPVTLLLDSVKSLGVTIAFNHKKSHWSLNFLTGLTQGFKYMKLFSKIALATATVSIASFASAAAVSGTTDFRVTLPEILVLYHWDDAHLILENTNNANNSAINDGSTREVALPFAAATHELNTDVITTSATKLDAGTIAVKLKNAWAVRSLSSGTVELKLENPKPTLYSVTAGNKPTTSTIVIGSPTLHAAATSIDGTSTGVATLNVKLGWAPVMGDIDFTLDLKNANHAGEYNTRGQAGKNTTSEDDTFLLTLTGK